MAKTDLANAILKVPVVDNVYKWAWYEFFALQRMREGPESFPSCFYNQPM